MFMDWEQEDAHEFMKELINSIHQNLNRVKVKPQYKEYTQEESSLEKMAASFWASAKERDDSYIYDSFCGQIYNNIKCISCQKEK